MNANTTDPKILSARITEMPRPLPEGMLDPMPSVYVTLDDGTPEQRLFDYYPDEISFRAEEFIGLTVKDAMGLRKKKDMRYLTDDRIPAANGTLRAHD